MSKKKSKSRISITFTALIWTGIFLITFGAVTAVFGIGGSTLLEVSIGNWNVKTSQVGLSILIVGALLSYFTAINLPEGTIVLADKPSFIERVIRSVPLITFITALIGFILLIIFSLLGF